MISGAVAKRYARALFEVAEQKGKLEEVEKDLTAMLGVLNEHPDLRKLLAHPGLHAEEKKEQMKLIFSGKWTEETENFIFLLIDRRREQVLEQVVEEYTKLANQGRGIADAIVTTAQPLSKEDENEIAQRFGKVLSKQLRITNVVDKNILGGIVVRIGDRVYDGSIAGKLKRFKQQLQNS
ncbi:F0F1 ATP synthase subunit delta [Microaerobacter geothermalis]|uniref:F0F1 ATP synthase subunit delta n=1 Tax=Microaerobacter geothermalis TaxID=674972 RepID=UPI001F4270CD|nr:F0F1 ATP synthase subunit delta [Microaerobacter geothermalis]MCF6093223.1 F0F1 ATP synthase subunit delta [Microaerobacter geothermalis]